jgi:hypothetical protein
LKKSASREALKILFENNLKKLFLFSKTTATSIYKNYPPGTQENHNSISSRNLIMGKGKELEFPEGWRG